MVQGTVRKKDSINATVSPSLKKKVMELVESGEYSSMSDVVTQALTKFFASRNLNTASKTEQILTEEPTRADTDMFEREIWKQKGITFQKMGRLEDAIKCFDKALGIEQEPGENSKKQKRDPLFSRELPQDFILE